MGCSCSTDMAANARSAPAKITETENLLKNSENKLKDKHCDLIVANNVSKKDIGFNKDFNKVTLIYSSGKIEEIKKNKKSYIATLLANKIVNKFLINDKNFS